MIENIEYLILLLPGFFVYITLLRFLGSNDKRNSLETVFYSFLLSIVIASAITFLSKYNLLSINLSDWRFGVWIIVAYITLTTILLIFFKKIFPWIERKTQIFDRVKSNTKDILLDVFDAKLLKSNKPIWLQIVMKDGLSITGNLSMQGLTKDKNEAIYLKSPKITNKNPPLNIDPLEGILISLKDIKFIGIINEEYDKNKKKQPLT